VGSYFWLAALFVVPELFEESLTFVRVAMTQENAFARRFRVWNFLLFLLITVVVVCHGLN